VHFWILYYTDYQGMQWRIGYLVSPEREGWSKRCV